MLPAKNNLGPDMENGLGFRLVPVPGDTDAMRVSWESQRVEMTAAQLLAPRADGDDSGKVAEAEAWLRAYLADGSKPAKEGTKQAGQVGIAERTLERARARLHVVSEPEGGRVGARWIWRLPESVSVADLIT
jgi:hypothetical protein